MPGVGRAELKTRRAGGYQPSANLTSGIISALGTPDPTFAITQDVAGWQSANNLPAYTVTGASASNTYNAQRIVESFGKKP